MIMLPNTALSTAPSGVAMKDWFEGFIANIQTDFIQIETATASVEKQAFYQKMATGSPNQIVHLGRVASSTYFIQEIVSSYVNSIKSSGLRLNKLAFDLSDAKVLVWVEIKENEENIEDFLLLLEAQINAKFAPFGFYTSSTIVEDTDNLAIPEHYQPLIK